MNQSTAFKRVTNLPNSYELQVRKIGQQAAETSGQPVYPIYEIAPYR
jgi:hypothetical protein